jgi:hypothetical protein
MLTDPSKSKPNSRIDILELVQDTLEQPDFTPDLIALMDSDLQAPMTAIASAVRQQDQTAANIALDALYGVLEG